jgi:hypothetical protein
MEADTLLSLAHAYGPAGCAGAYYQRSEVSDRRSEGAFRRMRRGHLKSGQREGEAGRRQRAAGSKRRSGDGEQRTGSGEPKRLKRRRRQRSGIGCDGMCGKRVHDHGVQRVGGGGAPRWADRRLEVACTRRPDPPLGLSTPDSDSIPRRSFAQGTPLAHCSGGACMVSCYPLLPNHRPPCSSSLTSPPAQPWLTVSAWFLRAQLARTGSYPGIETPQSS